MSGKPKKRNINLHEVFNFLKKKEFHLIEINQEWRHVVARGDYKGRKVVFKMASTQKTGKMTQNEFYWNEMVHKTPEKERIYFTVPRNLESGFFGKLFYLITEEFSNKLIERDSKDTSKIKENLKKITEAAFEIRCLNVFQSSNFYQSQASKEFRVGERLLESAIFWAKQAEVNLDKFINIIEKMKDRIRSSTGHGDFVPRQLYEVHGKIGIIDGEHAGIAGALYYDPAWFYLRLRLDHDAKELARAFLLEYKNLLNKKDRENFWDELKPVLTQRFIGEIWGAGRKSKKINEILNIGKDILGGNII